MVSKYETSSAKELTVLLKVISSKIFLTELPIGLV